MKRGFLSISCMMALWVGGCPARRSGTRLVYVPPAAPSPATVVAPAAGELVIEEPPPPPPSEPALGLPSEVPGQVPIATGRPPHQKPPKEPAATEQPPVEIPTLQPREENQDALRARVVAMQQDIQHQIDRHESDLDPADRKTREDARAFLAQSNQAMADGDLQRAWNLAHKASLLLAALGP